MKKYNRYIVFVWDEYDNAEPMPDINSSFNDKKEAINFAKAEIEKYWDFSMVFDCAERLVTDKFCTVKHEDYVKDGYLMHIKI